MRRGIANEAENILDRECSNLHSVERQGIAEAPGMFFGSSAGIVGDPGAGSAPMDRQPSAERATNGHEAST